MSPLRRAAAAAALTGTLLLVTGCGSIATTGVVESGPAATMQMGAREETGMVYFLTPSGTLAPVFLPEGPSHPSPDYLLSRLLAGPTAEAAAAGLTSALPPVAQDVAMKIGLSLSDSGRNIRVRLPFPVEPLTEKARSQVACTVMKSVDAGQEQRVVLVDPQGREKAAVCGTDSSS